jgi:hypothetical protein
MDVERKEKEFPMEELLELISDYYPKYDSLCYMALMGIYARTKDSDTIAFTGFDWENKEHKFLFYIAMNFPSTLGEKQIAIDAGWLVRRRLSRLARRKVLFTSRDNTSAINVGEFLKLLRPQAEEFFPNEGFDFGDIYEAYYAE